jgi:hypothetical protein
MKPREGIRHVVTNWLTSAREGAYNTMRAAGAERSDRNKRMRSGDFRAVRRSASLAGTTLPEFVMQKAVQREADGERPFSAERWRAARDLRADLACIVAVIAILAGLSRLDSDPHAPAPTETAPGAH